MTSPRDAAPWMTAWLAAQQEYAALAGAWTRLPAGPESIEVLQSTLADQYRRLFALPGPPTATTVPVVAGAAALRYLEAAERYALILAATAADAGRRLVAALAASGPDAPPITTLRELHALWIDCGEAAWSAAAHDEAFAAAQAELLAALVELRAAETGR